MSNLKRTAPAAVPEPGWIPITELPDFGEGQPFLTGDTAGNRLRVAYFLRDHDKAICARAWFGWAAEGPPGHAHGGSIFTVLDETMGLAAWSAGYLALAASITVHFKRKVPLGTDAVVEAWVCRAQGRKVFTHASLRDPQNTCICAEAEGLYITQHPDQFGTIRTLPEQFRKQAERNLPES